MTKFTAALEIVAFRMLWMGCSDVVDGMFGRLERHVPPYFTRSLPTSLTASPPSLPHSLTNENLVTTSPSSKQ